MSCLKRDFIPYESVFNLLKLDPPVHVFHLAVH